MKKFRQIIIDKSQRKTLKILQSLILLLYSSRDLTTNYKITNPNFQAFFEQLLVQPAYLVLKVLFVYCYWGFSLKETICLKIPLQFRI